MANFYPLKLKFAILFLFTTSTSLNSFTSVSLAAPATNTTEEDPAVTRFRKYLTVNKAVQPNPDYDSSVEWIKSQAAEIGLEYNFFKFEAPNLFEVVLTWRGADQSLPSIFLISHIDVVAVERSEWKRDPFAAEKDANGNIFARGTQDTRDVGAWYLEAVRRLKAAGVTPLRNVHIGYSPDEEVGGARGIKHFVTTDEFKKLNVAFTLDEGTTSTDNTLQLFWAERASWHVKFIAEGKAAHSLNLPHDTAMERMQTVMSMMHVEREKEEIRMKKDNLKLGEITTINLTVLKGGTAENIIPGQATAIYDIRIPPFRNFSEIQQLLDKVATSAGVKYEFTMKATIQASTPLTPYNVWWKAVQEASKEIGIPVVPMICAGGTDLRFIRNLGIPGFGLSPIVNTTSLLHGHNEYLNEKVYLSGIDVYVKLLPKFFNMPDPASIARPDEVPANLPA